MAGLQLTDVDYRIQDRVAVITLNRPDRLNAARERTHIDLTAAFDAADLDDGVRTIVVTGKGKAFCAGTDLSDGFQLPKDGNPATGEGVVPDIGGRTVLRLFAMRKPVIGAINGAAAGFGATFPLAMDFRLASNTARFGYVFVRRGIIAESCSSWFLPRLVGVATALDWMLTGRFVDAEEALAKGLVSEVLEPEDLLPRAIALGKDIADNAAPVSVAVNRQLIWRMLGESHPLAAHELESRGLAATLNLADATEGVAAFKEKRTARFSGRASQADFLQDWWPQSQRSTT